MKYRQSKRFKTVNPATVLLVKQFLLGLALFLIITALITGIWYGTRLETFTISTVEVSGGKTIKQSLVRQKAETILSGTYLRLIPRRFSYLYPEDELIQSLSEIERIKDVAVSLLSNTTLKITYDEYSPDALWCGQATSTPCYFLDNQGYAFGLAPDLSGGSLLRYYSLNAEPSRGISPFTPEDYLASKEFARQLAETGWYVTTVEIDAVRDAFFTLTPSGEVKITLTESTAEAFSFLETLRQSEEFAHLTPGAFQYIDLRFGSKVFVNEEPLVVAEVLPEGETADGENLEEGEVFDDTLAEEATTTPSAASNPQ